MEKLVKLYNHYFNLPISKKPYEKVSTRLLETQNIKLEHQEIIRLSWLKSLKKLRGDLTHEGRQIEIQNASFQSFLNILRFQSHCLRVSGATLIL